MGDLESLTDPSRARIWTPPHRVAAVSDEDHEARPATMCGDDDGLHAEVIGLLAAERASDPLPARADPGRSALHLSHVDNLLDSGSTSLLFCKRMVRGEHG